jgi:hypothetical protein
MLPVMITLPDVVFTGHVNSVPFNFIANQKILKMKYTHRDLMYPLLQKKQKK